MVHLVCNCKTNKDPFIGTMIFIAFRDTKMADLNFELVLCLIVELGRLKTPLD